MAPLPEVSWSWQDPEADGPFSASGRSQLISRASPRLLVVSACSPSQVIRESVLELKLQAEENFVLKVVQLEELLQVRHSVFVVGNAGCGKSQVGPNHAEDTGHPGLGQAYPMASHSFLVRAVPPPALPEQCLGRGQQRSHGRARPAGTVCQPLQPSRFGITAQGCPERDTPGQSRDKDRKQTGARPQDRSWACCGARRMTDRAAGRAWAHTVPCPGAGSAQPSGAFPAVQVGAGPRDPTAGRGC